MSNPRLPAEIFDYMVDFLHDYPTALKKCCLVSKSWIPRTRSHLFVRVNFGSASGLRSWRKMFPDPSTSPAHYVKSLSINSSGTLRAAGAEGGGWIRSFSHVVDLAVTGQRTCDDRSALSLVPLHGLSPVVKSLRLNFIDFPSSQISDFIFSFPVLEDLTVYVCSEALLVNGNDPDWLATTLQPSTSPVFTGSLEIDLDEGMRLIGRRLLSLPGGLHFRKLTLEWIEEEDLLLAMALVDGCSHTLEYLSITSNSAQPRSASLGLPKAIRLKGVTFRVNTERVDWIVIELRTITSRHRSLQQISICVYIDSGVTGAGADVMRVIGEEVCRQWLELDDVLTQLWESHSIRPKILCYSPGATEKAVSECVGHLLPKATQWWT